MTSGQKIAFSLLITLFLFAGFVMTVDSKLFDQLETRFYSQTKIQKTTEEIDKLSESCNVYIKNVLNLIATGDNAWLKNSSVKSYFVQNPSEKDELERRRLTVQLFDKIPALYGIRILDRNGKNIHYSSFDETDILKISGLTKTYKNYSDVQKENDDLSFDILRKNSLDKDFSVLFDESKGRLIICIPFNETNSNFDLCLLYLNVFDIQQDLINNNKLDIGQNITMYSKNDYNGFFVFGVPMSEKSSFKTPIQNYSKKVTWSSIELSSFNAINQLPEKILQKEDGTFWVILPSSTKNLITVLGVYQSNLFELSREIRIFLYICIFISVFLFIFLIFSFKPEPILTLKKKIKKLQLSILEDYLENKEKKEWGSISNQLRIRKKDLSDEIFKSIHVHSKKTKNELNEYLDRNWDEIFAIFDTKTEKIDFDDDKKSSKKTELSGTIIDEIRTVIQEVLNSHNFSSVSVNSTLNDDNIIEDVDELDEVEELAEDVDELDEAEEVIEGVDELDEAEEVIEGVDELDEAEEVIEDVDELDEVEELAEDVSTDLLIPKSLLPTVVYDYKPSNDTYFETELFPTVENLYAEELCIGSEINIRNEEKKNIDSFKFYPLQTYSIQENSQANTIATKDVKSHDVDISNDDLAELSDAYYALTEFAQNIEELQELESENDSNQVNESVIVEKNGVYCISDKLECSEKNQNSEFRELVESVL